MNWSSIHEEVEVYWLTGSSLADYLQAYELPAPVGLDVTEIGVGLHVATLELSAICRVTAVDVVPEALRGLPCQTMNVKSLRYAAPADLAICHLVLQHCSLEQAAEILAVPLKTGGTLAFQFARPVGVITSPETLADVEARQNVWHDEGEILKILDRRHLVITWRKTRIYDWRGDAIEWVLVKATR